MEGLRRFTGNPFLVLELTVDASRQEVERQGQKLIGLLELGAERALHYPTPLGPQPRTPELVRLAVAELRDPFKRALHEVWAVEIPAGEAPQVAPRLVWPDACSIHGWRPR